jgi:hypothetical protein
MTIRNNKKYSAEWIDLLSSESYSSSSSSSSEEEELKSPLLLLGKIEPPRSGGVTFTNNIPGDRLFAFGGYAEEEAITTTDKDDASSSSIIDRHVVNDMWQFLPYTNNVSSWGWTLRNNDYNENSFARAFGGDSGTANAGGESPPDPPSL